MGRGSDEEFWVFGYGSLMWRPGFRPAETEPARIFGYHRALCIKSEQYRGTKRKPGLVLGLDRGGSCHGMALRVPKSRLKRVLDYLHHRELRGGVYEPRLLSARLDDGRRRRVYAFVVKHGHDRYASGLSVARMVAMIRHSKGSEGSARDYLANTVAHLAELGLNDGGLSRLLARVDRGRTSA